MSVLVGRVGLVIKGTWDSSVAYAHMDVVTYNNSTYIAKQAVPAGTLPTNTTYWELSLDADLLQPKIMSSPVTIGGESKTTVEAAVTALADVKADETTVTSIIATGSTNTTGATITKGTYFCLNGVLVKAKADIASGATFTSGTNYEAVTVGDELSQLNRFGSYTGTVSFTNGLAKITVTGARPASTVAVIGRNTSSISGFVLCATCSENDKLSLSAYEAQNSTPRTGNLDVSIIYYL